MIVVLACTCGSSETLVRQALHRYEYKNWATEPIYQGKDNSLQSIENLLRKFPENHRLLDLFSYIKNGSRWAVFIGYDDDGVEWADISNGKMKDDVDAELIVEKYGK